MICEDLVQCEECAKNCLWTLSGTGKTQCFSKKSSLNGEYLYIIFPGQDAFCPEITSPVIQETGTDWTGIDLIGIGMMLFGVILGILCGNGAAKMRMRALWGVIVERSQGMRNWSTNLRPERLLHWKRTENAEICIVVFSDKNASPSSATTPWLNPPHPHIEVEVHGPTPLRQTTPRSAEELTPPILLYPSKPIARESQSGGFNIIIIILIKMTNRKIILGQTPMSHLERSLCDQKIAKLFQPIFPKNGRHHHHCASSSPPGGIDAEKL
ncbi:hypothetical protein Fcan01_00814 [Folsomia candida]|uniref:Uncharacterized protein n=1 Tax=Folsomia candida TaxID=158441 RepID=A0A226EVW0_FOLCA|nr:hypothetical protein Fcan01_00814 [Folsomia candida]